MRLIDSDALTDYWKMIDNLCKGALHPRIEDVVQSIEDAPTIEERKTGRWIKMSDVDGIYYACSECGEDIPRVSHYDPQFDLFPRLESIEKTNFCPNCGADMRNAVEIARDIIHSAIDHSTWSDTANVEEMHRVVDDKYADMKGERNE